MRIPHNIGGSVGQSLRHIAFRALRFYGAGSPSFGSGVPSGDLLIQAGTASLAFDASGIATLTLPRAFPGGIITVVGNREQSATAYAFDPFSKSQVTVRSGVASTTQSFGWIAIGW